jgi:SnoaL-like domain
MTSPAGAAHDTQRLVDAANCPVSGRGRPSRLLGTSLSTAACPADSASGYRAIDRLIYRYAELVDAGDFAAVGKLFTDATFTGAGGSVSGQDGIERML